MRMNNLLATLSLCVLLTAVAACGKDDQTPAPAAPVSMAAAQHDQANLKIVEYGPKETRASVPFNTQPSGKAALWMKLDHPVTTPNVAIWWGEHRLQSAISGDDISAEVPIQLFNSPGKYSLQVRGGKDRSDDKSNIVYFTVN